MSRESVRFCEESKKIGKILKSIRLSKKITQQELGEKLGLTFQQVQKYESGANRISLNNALNICDLLDVNITIFRPDTIKSETLDVLDEFNTLSEKERDLFKKIISVIREYR